jgi:hypothetical protein
MARPSKLLDFRTSNSCLYSNHSAEFLVHLVLACSFNTARTIPIGEGVSVAKTHHRAAQCRFSPKSSYPPLIERLGQTMYIVMLLHETMRMPNTVDQNSEDCESNNA